MRKLTALMMTVICLMAGMSTSLLEERVTSAAMIDQNNAVYRHKRYKYNDAVFSKRGCGPAAIANALNLLFGVTDQETANEVLYESLRLFTNSHKPAEEMVDLHRMERLTGDLTGYPTIQRLMSELGAGCSYQDANLSRELVRKMMEEAGEGPKLLICRLVLTEQWEDVLEVCEYFAETGHSDAMILLTYISSGTESTAGPFRSGEDGHYISMAFEAQAMCERGTFYVLDSVPRALPGEEYGGGKMYAQRYSLYRKRERLPNDFDLSHLQPSVVKAELKQERLDELSAMGPKEAEAARLKWMKEMMAFGRAVCIICIP